MQINILTVFERKKPEWKKIISYLKRKKMGIYTVFSAREVYEILRIEPINIILCEYHLLKIKPSAFQKKMKGLFNFGNIQGRSKSMQYVINLISSDALKNANVLFTEETGTGKEMVAKVGRDISSLF